MAYFYGQPRIETDSPVTNLVFTLMDWVQKFKHDDSHYSPELDEDVGEDLNLMQFTGLHDKNGKEIWEGDIVDDGVSRQTVRYDPHLAMFILDNNDNLNPDLEVIGNIHENPELLNS